MATIRFGDGVTDYQPPDTGGDGGSRGGMFGTQPVARTTEMPVEPPPTPTPTQAPPPTSQFPGYVNANDPMHTAIWNAFQKKGLTPRDQGDFQYWQDAINRTGGWANQGNQNYWLGRMDQGQGGVGDYQERPEPGWGQQTASSAGGTGVFNDPATTAFEQLLNSRVQQLQTPYQAPDMAPALDYLRSYFQKLQGPAYTPAQMDLMNTQTTDPLMRNRDAARQQIIERFARHGMGPGDGPVQDAIAQSDRSYGQMDTRGRAQVANNAIGMEKQQQGQAAALGPMIAQMEQQQFASQEGRNDQAVSLAKTIPDMAWSRLMGANGTIQNTNPLQALQLMNQFQGQGYQQGADFSQGLMGILPYLMQIFRPK